MSSFKKEWLDSGSNQQFWIYATKCALFRELEILKTKQKLLTRFKIENYTLLTLGCKMQSWKRFSDGKAETKIFLVAHLVLYSYRYCFSALLLVVDRLKRLSFFLISPFFYLVYF